MSNVPPDTRPMHRKRIGAVAEGITFALFIATIVKAIPTIMAAAAVWTVLALALPLFLPGAFTFAIPRSLTQEELERDGIPEPRSLAALPFMAFVLGMTGTFAMWGPHFFVALGYAALLGGPLFATVYAIDPPMRTAKQMAFLAVAALSWGLGTVAAILGLFFG